MAIMTQIDISEDIKDLIEKRLREELERELDLASKRFNDRKGEIIAGLLISVMKTTDMRIMEDRVVFEIKNKLPS